MARKVSTQRKVAFTVMAWTIGFLMFFPILWTFLTSFKSEGDAIASPPVFLFFNWTMENYHEALSNALMEAVKSLLQDKAFMAAYEG